MSPVVDPSHCVCFGCLAVSPWVRRTLTLDVGARVAVSKPVMPGATEQELMVVPLTSLVTGKDSVAVSGAATTSVVHDVLGETANVTPFSYLLFSGLCNLNGESMDTVLSGVLVVQGTRPIRCCRTICGLEPFIVYSLQYAAM